jgi:hypothetical protein
MPSCAFHELEMREVQRQKTYTINGRIYNRGITTSDCDECGAKAGQLHVPGCDVERCPACRGQAISCNCHYLEPDDD